MKQMEFKTKPDDGTAVPQMRRIDRPAEQPETASPPVFVRRERKAKPRPAANDEQPTRPLPAVLRSAAASAWDRMSKVQVWALGMVMGLVIGLPLLGWWVWPVQWTNASFNELAPVEQALVIETVADYYAYSSDPVRVAAVLNGWRDGESLVCAMAAQEDDFWARARLISIAAVRNGRGCD